MAPVESGFVLPESRLAVVTESELTGRRRTRRRTRPRRTELSGSLKTFRQVTTSSTSSTAWPASAAW
ncbi:MAG: hypothetical protein Ct9H300mP31_09820 [Acidimicrobiaceae bacterium]|nr:MAG: hypothetical protein Ct9H300mP31_09820 [Acidimicrobiaceae bacterium]